MRRSSKLAERARLETWVFRVKGQSSVTPRFLTESDKETNALPTVIKSWKEKEGDLDFRPEDTIIVSVLSSFSAMNSTPLQNFPRRLAITLSYNRHNKVEE